MSLRRGGDARLDAAIHDSTLRWLGVIEPDQPTAVSHANFQRIARAEFTASEREKIRVHLGLPPFGREE